jgi:hypothetical protein
MCPRQSEEAYAALDDGISDAEFTAVVSFWNTIAKSQDKFDEVTGLLRGNGRFHRLPDSQSPVNERSDR